MELDVTDFVEEYGPDYCMDRFSDSVAGSGLADVGVRTWNAALHEAMHTDRLELTNEQAQEVRDHFLAYGAWEESELEDATDLRAMLFQEVAAEYREHYEDLAEGEEPDFECSGGRLVRHDDGTWTYYVGR